MENNQELPTPGSVVLVDIDGHVAQHATGKHQANVVLSPKPSNDVNDPLRWSPRRKQIAHAMLMIYVLTNGIADCSLYSVLTPISEATDISLATLNAGTGYMFLLLGWGGLITQPFAMMFGKRPMYLISQLGTMAVVIWMAYIRSESEWLANKVIQGLFASPIEMLVEVSIADIFYAHERGFYVGLYGMTLFGSNFLAPLWAGFVNDALGYKWVFYVSAIQLAVGTVIMFFFMEETNYNRGTSELVEEHEGMPHPDAEAMAENITSSDQNGEKSVPSIEVRPATINGASLNGTPHSYFTKLRMFGEVYCSAQMGMTMVWRPLALLRFPVVMWAGFLYGSALVWYNVLNATASALFTDLYGLSASGVGLTYIGPLLGSGVAAIWSGWVGDRVIMWMTRRKDGVREPEYRLWILALNAVICPVGLILWGVGAARGVHWVGLVFGGGMVAFTSASGGATAINYAIDSYKDLSSEIILAVVLIRNSMSFAIGYGITPWLSAMGYQNTFILAAMVGLAAYISFLAVVKWGKGWRKATRRAYWGYVQAGVISH